MKKEQAQLVVDNLRLVSFTYLKYFSKWEVVKDELLSAGNFALCKAALTFKPSYKIAFSTYAIRCIRNQMQMMLRKVSYLTHEINESSLTLHDDNGDEIDYFSLVPSQEDLIKKVEVKMVINSAIKLLPNRYQAVLKYRYWYDFKQKEIASVVGTSQANVSRILTKAKRRVKELILGEDKWRKIASKQISSISA